MHLNGLCCEARTTLTRKPSITLTCTNMNAGRLAFLRFTSQMFQVIYIYIDKVVAVFLENRERR